MVALFASALFAGSSLGTWAAGLLGNHGHWSLLFTLTAVIALLLTVAAVFAVRAYRKHQRT